MNFNNTTKALKNFVSGKQKILLLIASLYVLVGITYLFITNDNVTYPDEFEYLKIADNLYNYGIFSADGVNPTAYRPPGFPFLLAGIKYTFGNALIFKILNIIFWMTSGFIIYHITKMLYSKDAGIVSLLLFLLYPVNLYTAGTIYPQTFSGMLMLIVIYLTFKPGTEIKLIPITIFSVALVMTVANFLVFYFIILTYLIILYRSKLVFIYTFISVIVIFAAMGTWSLRNYNSLGEHVLITTNTGLNLFAGNSESAGPNTGSNIDSNHREIGSHMSEVQEDKYYMNQAISWIRNNPGKAAVLYCAKFFNWFNYKNSLFTGSEGIVLKDVVMALTYYPILFSALASSFLWRGRLTKISYGDLLLWTIYLTAAATYAIFFTRIRFRVPFDAIIIILASPYIIWAIHESLFRWQKLFSQKNAQRS